MQTLNHFTLYSAIALASVVILLGLTAPVFWLWKTGRMNAPASIQEQ
jgi:hypothetical protein